jgi:hypothetical protein
VFRCQREHRREQQNQRHQAERNRASRSHNFVSPCGGRSALPFRTPPLYIRQ